MAMIPTDQGIKHIVKRSPSYRTQLGGRNYSSPQEVVIAPLPTDKMPRRHQPPAGAATVHGRRSNSNVPLNGPKPALEQYNISPELIHGL
jgi:hypothetical protein